jgi:hypothetical protein
MHMLHLGVLLNLFAILFIVGIESELLLLGKAGDMKSL